MGIKNKFRNGKSYKTVFWGAVLILAAVLLILDNIDLTISPDFTWWRIVGGVLLLSWVICELVRKKFADIFFPLAFLFILLEKPLTSILNWDSEKLPSAWIILLAAALLTSGFHVIFDRKTVTVNGNKEIHSGKMGKETLYADAAELSGFTINDHLGAVEVFIRNQENYTGGSVITVCNNLGLVTLHMPSDWNVVTQCSDNLGTISVPEHETSGDKSVTLDVHDNLGKVEVKFE